MSAIRLAIGIGAGMMGILYMTVALVPLLTGTIELNPTSLSIDSAESEGFPEVDYLEVTGGYMVFADADVRLEDDDAKPPVLSRLTVAVVSESLLAQWQADTEHDELPYAAQCRLLVSFEADQVAQRWPELLDQITNGDFEALPPVKMTLTGETIPADLMVFKPIGFESQVGKFNWEQARWLRFERHFNSAGRAVKNIAIGIAWLLLSLTAFKINRSHNVD